ncbi:hypothetical protein CVT25_004563, partial [Psilocybe cyanescens]
MVIRRACVGVLGKPAHTSSPAKGRIVLPGLASLGSQP